MAKIEEIDYDQIINKASQIAFIANNMQFEVKRAFQEIDSMRENWFGLSYDNFVQTVNLSISGLNKIFETTVSDIPHEIAAKARSYASSNQASTSTSLNEQTAIILTDITKTNKGAKLRFRSDEVSKHQRSIKTYFNKAKDFADDAKEKANSLKDEWKSISGDTNITELKLAFTRVNTILNNLSDALDGQISAQATTIEALENAANAVESAQNVAENLVDSAKDAATSAVNKIQQSASELWTNLTGKN